MKKTPSLISKESMPDIIYDTIAAYATGFIPPSIGSAADRKSPGKRSMPKARSAYARYNLTLGMIEMKKILALALASAVLCSAGANALAYSGRLINTSAGTEADTDGYITSSEVLSLVDQLTSSAPPMPDLKRSDFDSTSMYLARYHVQLLKMQKDIDAFTFETGHSSEPVTCEQAIRLIIGEGSGADPANSYYYAMRCGFLDNVDAVREEFVKYSDVEIILKNIFGAIEGNRLQSYSDYAGLRRLVEVYGSNIIYNEDLTSSEESALGSSYTDYYSKYHEVYVPYMPLTDLRLNEYASSSTYSSVSEKTYQSASESRFSTFSVDIDTASYSNMRRYVMSSAINFAGAVRTEELINYFDYDLPQPTDGAPFSVTTEYSACPWDKTHKLAMIGLRGAEVKEAQPQNLVLLFDSSESMYDRDKLSLVKSAVNILLKGLGKDDRISIVSYSNEAEVLADGISAIRNTEITSIVNKLTSSGDSNGEAGLRLAFEQAQKHKNGGNNRVILFSDGNFNAGSTTSSSLKQLTSEYRDKGIYLSVLGFGVENYRDDRLEAIADSGRYYFIDNVQEAKRVFSDSLRQTLSTVAEDVKISAEFNPAKAEEYRLIGYDNRSLTREQFSDDSVGAGEINSDTSVIAFYEIIPKKGGNTDSSLYSGDPNDLMKLTVSYKLPGEKKSIEKEYPVSCFETKSPSETFLFASSVAEAGLLLSRSQYAGEASFGQVIGIARSAYGGDPYGLRHEFVQLVEIIAGSAKRVEFTNKPDMIKLRK